jgi:tRNA-splicing ligase RtcB (3'-phosphate/5'-hydroxy nucleic acid ligase)
MPDGHPGYSLPIGGVVALDNAVSPAFVGYDISCMMMLTVLDYDPEYLDAEDIRKRFLAHMLRSSSFGLGANSGGKLHRF